MGHHRPTTRSKNKRSRPDETAEATTESFRKIILTKTVTEDDVHQLYNVWRPVCQGCRVNSKDNPNCFCGLIPPPNGSRKSGLWQKTSEIVNSLGSDPSKDLRSSSSTPAGLTNLGATCYANSILQCLFMNKSFREGVFSVEPQILEEEPVLNNLVRLFAKLHSSKMAFVDSAPFIQTLELDNSIQQDSHEFLTLLFSLLERCLSQSKVSKARTIVQDLFRGGVSHVTRCSKCGNESEASSKIEDFYGLELNVKGLKSLDESLDDYFSIEELHGDNQFYCDACATRADATRSIKLRSLPAVLNFQLKRCVFLPNTTAKKKITSLFHFPGELNMAQRLSDCSELNLVYDLSAVLIHKGSAVNSGHYTAHVKDDNTDEWWEFDDEIVSNLGQEPFGPTSSISTVNIGQNDPVDYSSSVKEKDTLVDDSNMNVNQPHPLESNGIHHSKTFSSVDAYMLMYALKASKINSQRTAAQSLEHKIESDSSLVSQETDVSLPSHILEDIEQSNAAYLDSCEQYKSKKEFMLNHIMVRRQEVRLVLSKAPVQPLETPYFWISSDWLRHWADSAMPSIIDNTSILCLHGKLPLSSISCAKRLSTEAWTNLYSQFSDCCDKYGGGPTLTKDDYCTDCIFEMGRNMARANVYRDQRLLMKELAEAALSGEHLDGKLYYISKSWLQQWLRRKNIDLPCDADSGPTASIRCPHGELMPEIAAGAKRILVPESLWMFFQETAMEVKPDDSVGRSTFSSESEPCATCGIELTEAAYSEDSLREFKLKQRLNHEKLCMNKNIALCPQIKYYLVPSSWLSKWRSYVNAGGKNASSAELDALNSVVDMLLCEKHSKLLGRPPELLWKRDLIFQKPSVTDGMTIIAEDDWRLFCEDWDGTESKGISAKIEIDSDMGDDNIGTCIDMSIPEEHLHINDGIHNGSSRRLLVKTSPQVCEECIGERECSELMRKLHYSNEDICVCLISGKEPPKSILEASGSISEPTRRTSKRSRKSTYGNSVNLNVSGTTSVYQLKMMIWETFGVVKENQILHKGSRVIDGETASLADMNIFPGDILWVTDSKIHENRDIADELSNTNLEVHVAEEGFRGTLLTSAISSQAVSEAYLNY
ncbi:ubiquitin carboxyl-terminal hydrolase 26 isoform X1 [Primulina eburnea]|uniref:ubiquitin carboxyl-terminal hydrolase 26 isoform X1 n=2 Tax=Primulina eburnea TaxID=1245227 RepID=UPI003C6C7E3C